MRDPFADDPDRACVGIPTDMFFGDDDSHDFRAAKRICRACPLLDDCREWAIVTAQAGVWGGTTDYERERIRADRNRGQPRRWARTPQRHATVAALTRDGLSTTQIAGIIGVSSRTVLRIRGELADREAAA